VFSFLPHKQNFAVDEHGGPKREENSYRSDPDTFTYILSSKESNHEKTRLIYEFYSSFQYVYFLVIYWCVTATLSRLKKIILLLCLIVLWVAWAPKGNFFSSLTGSILYRCNQVRGKAKVNWRLDWDPGRIGLSLPHVVLGHLLSTWITGPLRSCSRRVSGLI